MEYQRLPVVNQIFHNFLIPARAKRRYLGHETSTVNNTRHMLLFVSVQVLPMCKTATNSAAANLDLSVEV
jgi:hypothetical protein